MRQHPSSLFSPRALAYLGELARTSSRGGMGDAPAPAQFIPPMPASGASGGSAPSVPVAGVESTSENGWRKVNLKPSGSAWFPECVAALLQPGQLVSVGFQPRGGGSPVVTLPTGPVPPSKEPTNWAKENGYYWDHDVCPPRTAGWPGSTGVPPTTVSYGRAVVMVPPCTQWQYYRASVAGRNTISNFTNEEIPHTPEPGDGPLTLVGTYSPCPADKSQAVSKVGYDGTWAFGLFGKKHDVGAVLPGSPPAASATIPSSPVAPVAPAVPKLSFGTDYRASAPPPPPPPSPPPPTLPVTLRIPTRASKYAAEIVSKSPLPFSNAYTGGSAPFIAAAPQSWADKVAAANASPLPFSSAYTGGSAPFVVPSSLAKEDVSRVYKAPPTPAAAPNSYLDAFAAAARTGTAPSLVSLGFQTQNYQDAGASFAPAGQSFSPVGGTIDLSAVQRAPIAPVTLSVPTRAGGAPATVTLTPRASKYALELLV